MKMRKMFFQTLIIIIPYIMIVSYGQSALSFVTINTSQYDIYVWHNPPIWDEKTAYKRIIPPGQNKGWYYPYKDNISLSVGICNYGGDPVENTCSNDYNYGYPENNHYSWCSVLPHGFQKVTINDPNKPPILSCY